MKSCVDLLRIKTEPGILGEIRPIEGRIIGSIIIPSAGFMRKDLALIR